MKTFTNIDKHSQNKTTTRKTNHTLTALVLCTLLLFATKALAQTTHIVNNNAGAAADFTDLQAAIDAAADGDIIHVQQSSDNYGNITLNKSLTLIGRSHSDANYSSSIQTLNFEVGSSNSTIKGLNISTLADQFITGDPTTRLVEDLVIQDNKIGSFQNIGIYRTFNNILIQGNTIGSVSLNTNTSNVLISNNIFFGNSFSTAMADTLLFANNILGAAGGISIANNTSDLLNISNCIFVTDWAFSDPTVSFNGSGTFQIANCISYNYDTNRDLNFTTGSNITLTNVQENVDPLFTNRVGGNGSLGNQGTFVPGLDDLTLQASSPVVDDGLFQGYNFKTFGTPTGVPSLKIDTFSPTVPKNGDLNVTITAKTN